MDSDTLLFSLRFTQKHSHSTLTLSQTNSIWINLMMATILNSSILNSAILDSAILHKTLIQTNSIWLKLIHSHSTWWWQSSWTLPSWIQPFCTKRTSLIHSDSTWWWQPSWIVPCWIQTLPSWIQTPCYLLSDSIKNTLNPLWPCLKLIPSDKLNDDSAKTSILNSAILDSAILHKTLIQTNSIWLKLIHSHLTWWWQSSWILPSWIQPFCTLTQKELHSFILTQIDDGSSSWTLPCWIQTLPSRIQTTLLFFSQIHWKHSSFSHLDSESN